MLIFQWDCNLKMAMFLLILMPFLKARISRLEPNERSFQELSNGLISYFEIQYDNLPFKSAAFVMSRVVHCATCSGGTQHLAIFFHQGFVPGMRARLKFESTGHQPFLAAAQKDAIIEFRLTCLFKT